MADPSLSDGIKMETALSLLVKGRHPNDPELLRAIYRLVEEDAPQPDGQKVFDLEQDWEYVCAAFMQAYGIDLYRDKSMHIIRFRALLRGLPGNTKLASIIRIRAEEVPQPNKHNQKYIADLIRAKMQYALRSNTSVNDGWGRIFNVLKARATNGR